FCGFFFSSRRRHTRSKRDWSSDVCSSDLGPERFAERRLHSWHRPPRYNAGAEFPRLTRRPQTPKTAQNLGLFPSFPPGELLPRRSEERRVGKECRARSGSTH